jgi:hypothetical protein
MMLKVPNEDSATRSARGIIIGQATVLLEDGDVIFDTDFWLVECNTCVAGSSDHPNLSTSDASVNLLCINQDKREHKHYLTIFPPGKYLGRHWRVTQVTMCKLWTEEKVLDFGSFLYAIVSGCWVKALFSLPRKMGTIVVIINPKSLSGNSALAA